VKSQFASATSRRSVLLVLVCAACDTDTVPRLARDAALMNAADDAELADPPEMRDAHDAIDYFATEPLCESEVTSKSVGGDGICSVQVPSSDASSVDFGMVNLFLRVGGARIVLFQHVADLLACGALQAWHYDDASHPSQLVLCPEACLLAMSDPDTQIEIVLGCDGQ
jgi:hypothetical protein